MAASNTLKSLSTLCLAALAAILFGFLAPSLMGLALLAALVVVPVAILAAVGWLLFRALLTAGRSTPAPEPEAEP